MGFRDGLDVLKTTKICFPYQDLNPGLPNIQCCVIVILVLYMRARFSKAVCCICVMDIIHVHEISEKKAWKKKMSKNKNKELERWDKKTQRRERIKEEYCHFVRAYVNIVSACVFLWVLKELRAEVVTYRVHEGWRGCNEMLQFYWNAFLCNKTYTGILRTIVY